MGRFGHPGGPLAGQLAVAAVRADEEGHAERVVKPFGGQAAPREPPGLRTGLRRRPAPGGPRCSKPRGGDHPPPRGPLDQALLEQVWLVDVLDRVLLLVHRGGERGEAHRPAGELGRDRVEDRAVVAVEPRGVDLEQAERLARDSPVTTPAPRTSAKSRTRFRSRLATRGVPRERSAISRSPSGSTSTPRIRAGAAHDPRQVAGRRSARAGGRRRTGREAASSEGPCGWWRPPA